MQHRVELDELKADLEEILIDLQQVALDLVLDRGNQLGTCILGELDEAAAEVGKACAEPLQSVPGPLGLALEFPRT